MMHLKVTCYMVTINCFNFYYVNTCMFYVHGYYE
jgi:hypothetical protein